ncbi:unnamed protein product [Calicophoron daubneyi]|uniref:Gem-associated protein 2 n=1 Tax=Calicophoron daubneyi TaxID=300641 RepID=A0AAV2T5F7_CALDB
MDVEKGYSSSDAEDLKSEFLTQAFPVPDSDVTASPDIDKALTNPEEYIKYVRCEAARYPDVFYTPVGSQGDAEFTEVPDSKPLKPVSSSPDRITFCSVWFAEVVQEYQCLKRILLERTDKGSELKKVTPFEGSPLLSWIALRTRAELYRLLEEAVLHCTKKRWNVNVGRWIFALLVALEPPIDPDMCHLLRAIAKRCRKLKKDSNHAEEQSKSTTNFFDLCVHLVAKSFGQADLLEQ